MNNDNSQELFLKVQSGDDDAARAVFEQYLDRLVAMARARLSEKLGRKLDADDVVQSAFRSFFVRARDGQYTITRSGDLWNLLAAITRNKLLKKAEYYRQQKRSLDRDERLSAAEAIGDLPISANPSEAEAVALADEIEFLMRELDPVQRSMLELRLQGQGTLEIAQGIQRSERTVRRFLGAFRDQLENRLNELRTP